VSEVKTVSKGKRNFLVVYDNDNKEVFYFNIEHITFSIKCINESHWVFVDCGSVIVKFPFLFDSELEAHDFIEYLNGCEANFHHMDQEYYDWKKRKEADE
jgi:hypothetical protein